MSKADAAVDSLHPNGVLLVLVEAREDVQQLSFTDLRDQLDHVVEDNGGLLAHLWGFILRNRVVHCHEFLLGSRRNVGIDAWEELYSCELRCKTVSTHQALNHSHNGSLKVSDPDRRQNLLHALRRLIPDRGLFTCA